MRNRTLVLAIMAWLAVMTPSLSAQIKVLGKVCPNPAAPCPTPAEFKFDTCDLPFYLPPKLKWHSTYYSADFYAVLLKSVKAIPDDGLEGDAECAGFITEAEREKTQGLFSDRKVFTSRFGCSDHLIFYTNTKQDYNFLAVYAGASETEAKKFLAEVKALGQFPDANLRKMKVGLDYGD